MVLAQDPLDSTRLTYWLRSLPGGPSLGAGGTAFILNGNCSYFSGKDKPLRWAQGGTARLTVRCLGSGPRPAPCLSPAVSASFLMRAANLQSTCRWFWAEHSLSHCWNHGHKMRGERLKGKEAEPELWWTECGQPGGCQGLCSLNWTSSTQCPWNFSSLFHAAQL